MIVRWNASSSSTRRRAAATHHRIAASRRLLNPWWGVSGGSDLDDGDEIPAPQALTANGAKHAPINLTALRQVADLVSRGQSQEIYRAAVDAVLSVVGVDRASILVFDEDGVMRFRAWQGLSNAYRAAVEGHSPWTRDEPAPAAVLVPDVLADDSLQRFRDLFVKEGIRALAFIPLVHQGQLVGKFVLYFDAPHEFSQSELDAAGMVATQVAFALDRARDKAAIEELLKEREAWLAGPREALEAALTGESLETSLGVLLRTATERLGHGVRAAFYRANADGTQLHLVVGMSAAYAQAINGFQIGAESLACGLATHTGEPVITSDVTKEPNWAPWLWLAEKFDYRGCWSFPVCTATGKILGAFALYWQQPREAAAKELELAAMLTQAAAIIISRQTESEARQQAEEALRRSEAQLAAELADTRLLQAVSSAMIREEDTGALYEDIVDAAVAIMRSQYASMQTLHREHGLEDELELLAFRGFDPEAAKFWKRVRVDSASTCAEALRTSRRAIAPDVETCAYMAGSEDLKRYQHSGIRAVQTTPLFSRGGKLVGMISTHWSQVHEPSDHDLGLLDILARQAADVIERNRAHVERAADLHAMNRLREVGARCAQRDCSVDEGLDAIMKAAIDVTGADKGNMQLVDSASGGLVITAQLGFIQPFLKFFDAVEQGYRSACGAALLGGKRIVVEDVTASPIFLGTPALDVLREAGVLACQSTPIVASAGNVLGMISTHWSQPHAPSERVLRAMDLLARQAADFLERKRAEQALRDADRAKDEFLAMLGHELRNPLGALVTAVRVLDGAAAQDPMATRARAVIDRQVRQLTRLVDDLLDVGRVTAGKIELSLRPLDLAEMTANLVTAWRVAGRMDRHSVVVETTSVWVAGDETRLAQVIANLLGNALKYTPVGGTVIVRALGDRSMAFLEIEDSGVGIPSDLIGRVFDLFVQGDRSLDREEGGLGIGLTLVRRLVELHGGTVEARSAGLGRGSTFTVRLPAISPARAASASPPKKCGSLERRRVLIIEDNDDAREMLRCALEQEGYVVYVAADGQDGIAQAVSLGPDVALVDIGLPGVNGYDVARRIRTAGAGNRPILVALTGYGREEDRRRAEEAGFDRHLVKPVDPAKLVGLIAELPPQSPR